MAFNLDNIATQESVLKEKTKPTSFLQKEIVLFNKAFTNKIKEDFYTELSVFCN